MQNDTAREIDIDPHNEANYNVRQRHADALDVMSAWKRYAAEAREQLAGWREAAFGSGDDERIDVFPAATENEAKAPAVLFIHGGYWQGGDKRDVSFVAPLLVRAGVTVAINNYALAPGASLDTMLAQTRAALRWLHGNAARLGIDANRLYVMGHSAGGHLAAMMLTEHGTNDDAPLRGAIALSGLFDLAPLVTTSINRALGLDAAQAQRLSPARLERCGRAPVYTLVGADETPGFFEQQARLGEHWHDVHALAPATGKHHYTILDVFREPANATLADLTGILTRNVHD
ncbi:alpha/beta hydrolase [Paraburkholderia acidisoli]|uniref:Alpha/beta hydrolase fold domain-containing protein n=1 Tax=Paraburkholderia acidisoli TaxID=2571748 RepID=A0A7Z2GP59_9BURK|nr:alpha/beta hydrolase [Paraburkholderia acidisoli]QGZ65014.1 alpha/beta hydrolase fold domain-containing protein [Paraburkholderia acidisoli]